VVWGSSQPLSTATTHSSFCDMRISIFRAFVVVVVVVVVVVENRKYVTCELDH